MNVFSQKDVDKCEGFLAVEGYEESTGGVPPLETNKVCIFKEASFLARSLFVGDVKSSHIG